MRSIKDKGNKSTERRLRAILVRAGIRGWKMHPTGLPGKPDFLFPQPRIVVFVDGCYWHGCPQCGHIPNVNRPYWSAKIEGNRRRDQTNTRTLEEAGNRVLRVWEHELLPGKSGQFLARLRAMLADQDAT
ncbi:MAG: very short patch repair endonuclease [Planctomycetes bacterium]|nr:very short patch repair endonuclease [Planctomycetota bacterium]